LTKDRNKAETICGPNYGKLEKKAERNEVELNNGKA
jgi:hypothetical protein